MQKKAGIKSGYRIVVDNLAFYYCEPECNPSYFRFLFVMICMQDLQRGQARRKRKSLRVNFRIFDCGVTIVTLRARSTHIFVPKRMSLHNRDVVSCRFFSQNRKLGLRVVADMLFSCSPPKNINRSINR